MTADEAHAAVEAGRRIADEEVDAGADLLIAGDMGIGNTTAATTLIAALTDAEPVAVVGRGTGIDDAGWARKTAAIRDALYRARGLAADPAWAAAGLRRRRSGRDGGFLRSGRGAAHPGAAGRRRGDGRRAGGRTAGARRAAVVAGAGTGPPNRRTRWRWRQLELEPIVDLVDAPGRGHRRGGRAAGLRAAVATLASMATFDEASVVVVIRSVAGAFAFGTVLPVRARSGTSAAAC